MFRSGHRWCLLLRLLFLFTTTRVPLCVSSTDTSADPKNIFYTTVSKIGTLFGRNNPTTKLNKKNKNKNNDKNEKEENMGQAVRMIQYDRAANERNAIKSLNFLNNKNELWWYRLDDGVMGGQSASSHSCSADGNYLHFQGIINTDGGGFCSIRAILPPLEQNKNNNNDDDGGGGLPPNTKAIRLRYQGDGKTYKFLLSDGSKSFMGPTKRSPSWQADIPTKNIVSSNDDDNNNDETIVIPLASLKPTWGGGPRSQPSPDERANVSFQVDAMKEIGFMLSLKLSDGRPNPKETFGEGIFPFSLKIKSIEPILSNDDK